MALSSCGVDKEVLILAEQTSDSSIPFEPSSEFLYLQVYQFNVVTRLSKIDRNTQVIGV